MHDYCCSILSIFYHMLCPQTLRCKTAERGRACSLKNGYLLKLAFEILQTCASLHTDSVLMLRYRAFYKTNCPQYLCHGGNLVMVCFKLTQIMVTQKAVWLWTNEKSKVTCRVRKVQWVHLNIPSGAGERAQRIKELEAWTDHLGWIPWNCVSGSGPLTWIHGVTHM